MSDAPEPWANALTAVALVSLDPSLGGVALRARAGPVREAFVAEAKRLAREPLRRVPPGIEDERLLGGLDLAATLSAGRPVMQAGLLGEVGGGTLVVPMAERMGAGLAARITLAMDHGAGFAVLALDEGAEPEEAMPGGLRDRLAFWASLEGVRGVGGAVERGDAAACLAAFRTSDEDAVAFVEAAAALGIASLRAPLLALRAARAKAALDGDVALTEAAVRWAARMVLGPRAVRM
ncbi:MAG: magnesium chelatase ATPase subunit D, partial [Pseudomonadota bacterium]